jgi:ferric-dicitrate binding protein FerR (iron transport regulator)
LFVLRVVKVSGLWLLLAAALSVCLAQNLPSLPADGAAKVIALSGQVSALKDSGEWALSVGDSVPVQQLIVTGPDGSALFQVADGSTFEVYPNSKVTFRNNPGNWRDLVDVWIGRIKTHIEKLGGQPNHNRIHTPTAVISVRGTTFDVSVEDDESTLVVVEEGQVAVEHALLPSGNPKLLNPGEWLRIFKYQPIARQSFDKGSVLRGSFRALSEALYTVMTRGAGGSTGIGGHIPTGVGDRPAPAPPPPPPTAPPPPPPPPSH